MGKVQIDRRGLAIAGLAAAATVTLAPAAAKPRRPAGNLALEDRAGIQDLFTRYLWAYDCNDEQDFLALFTDDALIVGKGKIYPNKAAILGWLRYLIAIRDHEGDDTWMHEAGQFRFIPNGQSCIVHAYATQFNGNTEKATRGVRSLGYFSCECVKVSGEWKFRRFSISAWDNSTVPWKKPLPWADLPPA
jgi:SnoaL-like domain